jgi:hypothetical protein
VKFRQFSREKERERETIFVFSFEYANRYIGVSSDILVKRNVKSRKKKNLRKKRDTHSFLRYSLAASQADTKNFPPSLFINHSSGAQCTQQSRCWSGGGPERHFSSANTHTQMCRQFLSQLRCDRMVDCRLFFFSPCVERTLNPRTGSTLLAAVQKS